jgi:alpha/beta superfamily hydrolase
MDSEVEIEGPAGVLEGAVSGSPDSDHWAVLCHPHPLYGGNMHDAVLDCLARGLLAQGVSCVRFNFRGVGASHGEYSGQGGEVDDLRAVIDWVGAVYAPQHLTIGGYSFGASVVTRLGFDQAARTVLIAPPLGQLPVVQPSGSTSVEVIVGEDDEFVDLIQLRRRTEARIQIISAANHFFAGREAELEAAIGAALNSD